LKIESGELMCDNLFSMHCWLPTILCKITLFYR